MLLVDIQDSLFRLKDQISWGEETWLVEPARLAALAELLDCFESTMRSIELFFQAGGVGVSYYRKNLLERTFAPRLEQYKVLLLLSMQPESRFVSLFSATPRRSIMG
jgi:cob(I)alamin adenosyltransferase